MGVSNHRPKSGLGSERCGNENVVDRDRQHHRFGRRRLHGSGSDRLARLWLKEKKAPVKIITADMSGVQAEDAGMVCGGRIEVLLEVIE